MLGVGMSIAKMLLLFVLGSFKTLISIKVLSFDIFVESF
jgi:hypothetical protein